MSHSSLLGGDAATPYPQGRALAALGPSDSSDSGSDALGEFNDEQLAADSDRHGTGERPSVDPRAPGQATDILPDAVRGGPGSTGEVDDLADEDTLTDEGELGASVSGV